MKKLIILFIAALLSTGAYAADTDTGSPTLTKKEQRNAAPSEATRASWNSVWELPTMILTI